MQTTRDSTSTTVTTYAKLFGSVTDGLSGADIAAVCREAAVVALRRCLAAETVQFEDIRQCIELAIVPVDVPTPSAGNK